MWPNRRLSTECDNDAQGQRRFHALAADELGFDQKQVMCRAEVCPVVMCMYLGYSNFKIRQNFYMVTCAV